MLPIPSNLRASNRYGAFTLIELLIVLAIIAILLGILIPTINTVRSSAKKVDCMNRQRQTGMAILLYSQQNKGLFPSWQIGSEMWYSLITEGWSRNVSTDKYDANRVVNFFCSEDPNLPQKYADFQSIHIKHYFSIGYNDFTLAPSFSLVPLPRFFQVISPSSTIMLGDTMVLIPSADSVKSYGFARVWRNTAHESALFPRHSRGMMTNICMVDGRVTSINATKPYDYGSLYRNTSLGGAGIIPDGSNQGDGTTWWDL